MPEKELKVCLPPQTLEQDVKLKLFLQWFQLLRHISALRSQLRATLLYLVELAVHAIRFLGRQAGEFLLA